MVTTPSPHLKFRLMKTTSIGVFLSVSLWSCAHKPVGSATRTTVNHWPQLGRGAIVVLPLIDLREEKIMSDNKKQIKPLSDEERSSYSEKLRDILFPSRAQHLAVTTGAIADRVRSVPHLNVLARMANSGQPMKAQDSETLRKALSPAKYILFFSITGEDVNWNYSREQPADANGLYQNHVYSIERKMSASVAIWDSDNNTIIYKEEIKPIASTVKSQFVKTRAAAPRNRDVPANFYNASEPDKFDLKPNSSLDIELTHHKERFPSMPERDPAFSKAFDQFLPQSSVASHSASTSNSQQIQQPKNPEKPSKSDNLRAEITLKATTMGVLPLPSLFIGAGVLKWNFLRIGGGIEFTPISTLIDHNLILYDVWNACLCFSADVEWDLGRTSRIQTGLYLGGGAFNYKQSDMIPTLDGLKPETKGDGYIYRAPRVRYLYGDRNGAQLGFGVYQHYYIKLDRPELVENHPSLWGIEITIAGASD